MTRDMRPGEYFPRYYREDLRVFAETNIPQHGPFWMLCGMTLGKLFEPGRPKKYADPAGFLCILWLLNLSHQGIYTYFPAAYPRWLHLCEPFPDIRGCSSYHGGVCSPGSLLRFARDPSYIPRARPFEMDEAKIREFFQSFFKEYLNSLGLREKSTVDHFSSSKLLERLRSDPSSPEVARYA